jgi:hypothetical protein
MQSRGRAAVRTRCMRLCDIQVQHITIQYSMILPAAAPHKPCYAQSVSLALCWSVGGAVWSQHHAHPITLYCHSAHN